MLYKFKSKAAADLIMLEPQGRRLLQIIGKGEFLQQGILLPEQMASALAALEAALAAEDAARAAQAQERLQAGQDAAHDPEVSLRQRALPFLAMVRRCQQAGKEIVWGV